MKRLLMWAYPLLVVLLFGVFMSSGPATGNPRSTGPGQGNKHPVTQQLPVVGSMEKLVGLLTEMQKRNSVSYRTEDLLVDKALTVGAPQRSNAVMKDSGMAKAEAKSKEYSDTNLQVKGVDESDVVKTDGRYIYQVNQDRVLVIDAYPAADMKLVSTISFDEKDFSPQEIYLDNSRLVVIGQFYPSGPLESTKIQGKTSILPIQLGSSTVKALVFDVSDKTQIKKVKEAEIAGDYISSRRIGANLYLVANQYIDYWYNDNTKNKPQLPAYRDSASADKFVNLQCQDIRYFPNSSEPNYLVLGSLNLDQPDKPIQVSAYLGSGQNIYCSDKNLYVSVMKIDRSAPVKPASQTTLIYKFALDQDKITFAGEGSVPGSILNQFAMDENDGNFRIATTTGEVWGSPENTSANNLYVLNDQMQVCGKIENIAPGERIYSVRFIGDRGYIVTFKKVDPLFVIDLKDPQTPKILGKLKIPGYSDYLHPYDENHIIGFGKDTVEATDYNASKVPGGMAYYQGMKIALFDVTDVNHPIEEFKEVIGDRGTDSELLRNHKALLFSRDKNLLAFPVTVTEIKNKTANDVHQYGEFVFQGAYVFNIDLEKGFTLKGKITHLSDGDYQKAGDYWADNYPRNVERVLYIQDTLYTLSKDMIKANRLDNLEEVGNVTLR